MHSLNITDVQKETIRLLNDTQSALKEVLSSSYIVDGNESGQQQTLEQGFISRQQDILINEKQKAENLEMVIAVVGTMKAGKSTSINAMVGQEVLPNRALPMTALPTLVTHTHGQAEPVLYFEHTQPLIELSRQLISMLDRDNDGYAFLGSEAGKQLSAKLKQNNGFHFAREYKGQKEIFEFLQELNDLMRMAKELGIEPPYAEYQSVDSLPRIEVEFYHLKHSSAKSYGKLSILDTPGPNEFGQSEALKKVFQTQLRQASAVLLVMDYTQLNSESDGALRKEVDSIKKDLGDRLFVLVNKFDNANKNTMDKEQTRHYVATKLLHKFPEDKVFPVSSWFGFLANMALNESEKEGSISSSEAWVGEHGGFAEKIFGEMWEESDLKDIDKVKKGSVRLWEKSGFACPVNNVIREAHTKAAFEALGSSLDKISSLVGELDKGAKGRISGLEVDAKTLKNIVDGIESDLRDLDVLEDKFEKNINAQVTIVNNKLRKLTKHSIEDAISCLEVAFSIEKNNEVTPDKDTENDIKSIFVRSPVLRGLGKGINWVKEKKKYTLEEAKLSEISDFSTNGEGFILFLDKAAAEEFLKKVAELLDKIILDINSSIDPIIKERLIELQSGIDILMNKNVNKVIERARERLQDNGIEVSFNLPSFIMKDYSQISYDSFLDNIEDKTEMRVGNRRKDGVWAGFINFFNDSWGREEYTKKVSQFEISLESIRNKSKSILEDYSDKIEKSQSDFLANDLKKQVNGHIENIQNYLDRYRGDLIQGLNDQRKSQEKKDQQNIELKLLIPKLSQYLEDVEDQLIILNDIRDLGLDETTSSTPNQKTCKA